MSIFLFQKFICLQRYKIFPISHSQFPTNLYLCPVIAIFYPPTMKKETLSWVLLLSLQGVKHPQRPVSPGLYIVKRKKVTIHTNTHLIR